MLRRDFILAPRCARAILKNSNLHILHHTYSVTDKNNIQDFMVLAMGGMVEKWVGAPILPFLQGTIYNINYNTPQLLPGIPDLQNLFRKGAITEEVFRCLVRANGSYDSWQMKIAMLPRFSHVSQ